jgi:HlyD family secretion protein
MFGSSKAFFLPLFSLIGVGISIFVISAGGEAVEPSSHGLQPAQIAATRVISGAGIVEAKSRNVKVASHLPGVVEKVWVSIGQRITKGTPLFSIDTRHLQAERVLRQASLNVARAELAKAVTEFELVQPLFSGNDKVVAKETYLQRKNAKMIAEERAKEAEKYLQVVEADLERSTVLSPIDSEVLQVNIREGEYVAERSGGVPALVIGDTSMLHVRVDLNENDAIRFKSNAIARAFLKGDSSRASDLHFEAVEPLVIPKQSLTGESTERVDTRVLQVLYSFDPKSLPLYVGQQVDVLVEEQP